MDFIKSTRRGGHPLDTHPQRDMVLGPTQIKNLWTIK